MSSSASTQLRRVGICGLGTIGKALARTLDDGRLPGLTLAAASVRDPANVQDWMNGNLRSPITLAPLHELARHCDIVVECAPAAILAEVAEPTLQQGKRIVVLSVGALLELPHLIDLARHTGGQIIIPTGALLGLDAVTAAAEGHIHSVRMVTHKPVSGLVGAPFLAERDIDISSLREPQLLYQGNARGAARGFPANVNVAAALALAGIGAERTQVEIWANPTVTRNTHTIEVDSDSASFTMTIRNIPTDNPKTGRITVQSLTAALRKMHAPLRVGT